MLEEADDNEYQSYITLRANVSFLWYDTLSSYLDVHLGRKFSIHPRTPLNNNDMWVFLTSTEDRSFVYGSTIVPSLGYPPYIENWQHEAILDCQTVFILMGIPGDLRRCDLLLQFCQTMLG